VPWVEFNQPDPPIDFDKNGVGTVRIMLLERLDDAWRDAYNSLASARGVSSSAVPVDVWAGLKIEVGGYDPETHPRGIFRALNRAVELLGSGAVLPDEQFREIPVKDSRGNDFAGWEDGHRYVALAALAWWDLYKSVGPINKSPTEPDDPFPN
jgi:hypothetical protein